MYLARLGIIVILLYVLEPSRQIFSSWLHKKHSIIDRDWTSYPIVLGWEWEASSSVESLPIEDRIIAKVAIRKQRVGGV
ncbi:hypothetical protein F4678DRAFT_451561, partial [Xylaria arbuscula]